MTCWKDLKKLQIEMKKYQLMRSWISGFLTYEFTSEFLIRFNSEFAKNAFVSCTKMVLFSSGVRSFISVCYIYCPNCHLVNNKVRGE